MNKLVAAISEEQNVIATENGAKTYASTMNKLYDFFALGAAMRVRQDSDIISLFSKAFAENPLYSLKCLFYFRDIRGGQGERNVFRVIFEHLANTQPEKIKNLIPLVPEFGRWDDLFVLFGTRLERDMLVYVKDVFENDMKSEKPTLLGKWLYSPNTSSSTSRIYAKELAKAFGLKIADYRKALSSLRKKIGIVERQMSANKWAQIEYSKVPSRASMIYRAAFYKQDTNRYEEYLKSLEKGETKINAGTLYPYDIVDKYVNRRLPYDKTLEELWKALPDYVEGVNTNAIVVADVSGSMSGLPMAVSISLAIYFAERSSGPFSGHFFTFSENSRLQRLEGSNLYEKVNNLARADWGGSTNIQAVFDKILEKAVAGKLLQKDLPSKIFIVSDMEFNEADRVGRNKTNFEVIKEKYKEAGYEMPQLVFWNVNSHQNNVPVQKDERGVYLVSGCSAATFKNIINVKEVTGVELMLNVLNSPRYEKVVI